MPLITPKFLILDTSTLGNVAKDYWSTNQVLRDRARKFISDLSDRSVHLTFTMTNTCEVIRHENEDVVGDRIAFLRSLPLIAWLRPYDHLWFTGCVLDLLMRELEAYHCHSIRNWQDIVHQVRTDLWETATGEELFGFPNFWSRIRIEAQKGIDSEKYIASVARTNPGHLFDMKLSEAYALPRRPKEERNSFMQGFAADLKNQLDEHGDPKLKDSRSSAIEFTKGTVNVMQAIDAKGGDPLDHLPAQYGIPKELINPEMTIGELGELGSYVAHLKVVTRNLPRCSGVTIKDVPIGALPSFVLDSRLSRIQQKSPRVTGSNIGDRRLAAMVLYADGLDVDKRTHDYLRQVQNADPSLKAIMRPYFRGSDYTTIPQRFD